MPVASQVAIEDRAAIADMIHLFFRLVDQGRASETAALFAPSARLTFAAGSPKPGTIEGDAIAGAMAAREQQVDVTTRHVISNVITSMRSDGSVDVNYLLTLYRSERVGEQCAITVADIDERVVRHGESWRIAERTIMPVFKI
jgi:hypothetical protein